MTSARFISEADRSRLVAAVLSAAGVDYLDVWFIVRLVSQELELERGDDAAPDVALAIISELLETGQLRAGDLVSPGDFSPWATSPDESLERVRTGLRKLEGELDVGDIAWFEVPE